MWTSLKKSFIAVGGKLDKHELELLSGWGKALIQMTKLGSRVTGMRGASAVGVAVAVHLGIRGH